MVKSQPDRLYGRQRSHALRPRQEKLLAETLPRLRFRSLPAGPVWMEVGFGGGEHARALAASHPGISLIACEVFAQGLCSMLAALVPEGGEATAPLPPNLTLWDGDARALLRDLPPACLDRLYLMFPDPWPKARHAKRRFVHPEIVALVASRLKAGAEWRAASDDPTYQAWVADIMTGHAQFDMAPPARSRPDDWPATRYEAKAYAAGRQPLYWRFTRSE